MSERKHVLFVNRVYPPAEGATGALLAELAPDLVARGWRVTVLTGPAPDAPASELTGAGVRVERVQGLRFSRASTLRRAVAYLSLYPAFLARALRLDRPDVIVTKTDPPMQLVLGALLRRALDTRAVHWAQDLYPEVAEELDVIKPNGGLARTLRRLSTWALTQHDHTVAVGRCMRDRLVRRGLAQNRVTVIPNWPPDTVHPVSPDSNTFRHEHDLDGRFVVMYSGNMGLAHPFGTMLAAAERLAHIPDLVFLYVGEGPRRAWLEAEVERRQLGNVSFLPFQPRQRLAESLSAADLHLVSMQSNICGLVVPSKMYGVLAAGRPALFLGPPQSEVARLLDEHACGTTLPSPSGDDLAAEIMTWYHHPEERQRAGARAYKAVAHAREQAFESFDQVLSTVVDESTHTPKALSRGQVYADE